MTIMFWRDQLPTLTVPGFAKVTEVTCRYSVSVGDETNAICGL